MPSINLSNVKKNSWERLESNPGLVGEKHEHYLCAMTFPPLSSMQNYFDQARARNRVPQQDWSKIISGPFLGQEENLISRQRFFLRLLLWPLAAQLRFFYLSVVTSNNFRVAGSQFFPCPGRSEKGVEKSWDRIWVLLLRLEPI